MTTPPTRVLVAYASAAGSTREIAEFIGAALADVGTHADVASLLDDPDPAPYAAVVLGSAIHTQRWLPYAERYVQHHRDVLRGKPVWMFSVGLGPTLRGPVGRRLAAAVPKPVAALREAVGARDYRPFAGVFARTSTNAVTRAVYRAIGGGSYGDLRDWEQIRNWAGWIASTLPVAVATSQERDDNEK